MAEPAGTPAKARYASRRLLLAVAVVVAGLVTIGTLQAVPNRHAMQRDLTARSQRALQAAGLSDVDVRFIGRDGTVTAGSAVDADRAAAVVRRQDGVRVVTVHVRAGGTRAAAGLASPATTPGVTPTAVPGAVPSALAGLPPGPVPGASPGAVPGSAPPVQDQLAALPEITFETGSAALTAQGRASVATAAGILRAAGGIRVRIEGHTDSTGTPAVNLVLSQARAQTVLAALVALGIAPDRLTAVGYGDTRPEVPDTTAANRAINRRVDFVVLP